MTITTNAQLEDHLKSTGIEYTAIEQLSGGTANFVWRITLPSGESRVIKHAEPYIKDAAMMLFPVDRMDFEARALTLIPEAMASGITLPALHHYDTSTHTLHLSSGGRTHLKAAYSNPRLPIPTIGAALGAWLAALHVRTATNTTPGINSASSTNGPSSTNGTSSTAAAFGTNTTGASIARYAYTSLHRALSAHGCDPDLGHAVNAEFGGLVGKEADDEGVGICHGDFWPGNVLVEEEVEGGGGQQVIKLMVIDWEISRRGTGATDMAQFAAEAYLLDRFCGGRGLLPAFINAYVEAAGRERPGIEEYETPSSTVDPTTEESTTPRKTHRHSFGFTKNTDETFLRRAVVHFGVHVAFWPTCVEWGDTGATDELVRLGCDVMEMGMQGDWEGVRGGPIGGLVGGAGV